MITEKNILIISNDSTLYTRLDSLLKKQGYIAEFSESADPDIRSKIDQSKPDLIVVDPDMPALKGLETSLLVRQWTPVPILMLSGYGCESHEVRALDIQSEDYLSEPFNAALATAKIDHLLSLSPAG